MPLNPRRRSEAPLFVDNVEPTLGNDDSLTINYDLHPNEQLPDADGVNRHHLAVDLRCGEQQSQVRTRPIDGHQHPYGLFQTFGALFGDASAYDVPCELKIEFINETPYERNKWLLFTGCATRTRVLRQGLAAPVEFEAMRAMGARLSVH